MGQIERALPHMGDTPIIASISGDAPDEIARYHTRLEPLTTAVELNTSSPNKRVRRAYQRPDEYAPCLIRLIAIAASRYSSNCRATPIRRQPTARAKRIS